jgi:hypothetical protein
VHAVPIRVHTLVEGLRAKNELLTHFWPLKAQTGAFLCSRVIARVDFLIKGGLSCDHISHLVIPWAMGQYNKFESHCYRIIG